MMKFGTAKKIPENAWNVEMEVREQGAIGTFALALFRVRALTPEEAIMWAREDAVCLGYESRLALAPTRVR